MPSLRNSAIAVLIIGLAQCPVIAGQTVDYVRHVKPILKRHCSACHNAKKQHGGLRMDLAKHLLVGGDSGKAIIPGQPAKSLIVKMVQSQNGKAPQMPRKRTPLSAKEIRLLTEWINQGAKAPEVEKVAAHWSFVPPKQPALPKIRNAKWVRNAIDYFVLARLEEAGLAPSAEAGKVTLIRRVYLDLLGLPPSIKDVDAFLKDDRPQAFERLVDKVLTSPHYGERWGRHWLDVARYADSNGFTIDSPREIWLYRDWVVNALNKDMPFDRFVIEQFAGDMLPNATKQQQIATGFHRNTLINQEGGTDQEQFRVDAVADRISTTGLVFLGLTLGCARCHDHKYDPISQKEFYQLFAFLNNQSEPTVALATPALAKQREEMLDKIAQLEKEQDEPLKAYVQKLPPKEQDRIKDNISMILNLRPDQRTDAQKRTLEKYFKKDASLKKTFDAINAVKRTLPKFPTSMVLRELPKPRVTTVHIKGDFTRKGDRVFPLVPAVLHDLPKPNGKAQLNNRIDLARWLVDPKNPLTARVTVNRIWQRYFGSGIVATENDFGTQGTLPSHPQLLDWLAVQFVRSGWKMKELHKLIVTSATYRQSSTFRSDAANKIDPRNILLARQNRFRLDAEIVRDNALTVSGLLSRKMGGPSVYPPQPKGVYAFTQVKRQWNTATGEDRYRRGMYTFLQRSLPYPMLKTFDAPDGNAACTRRVRSNTPLQALTLLNDKAFMEIAHGLAKRVLKKASKSNDQRLQHAFRLCLARKPDANEAKLIGQYVERQLQEFGAAPADAKKLLDYCGANTKTGNMNLSERAAWTSVARVLLNLDEFITRE